MPVLDTNFLIALDDKDEAARGLLAELAGERLLVPSLVAAEYATGFVNPEPELERLAAAFQVEQTTAGWMRAAAKLRRTLRGKAVRRNDVWIAAWASLHATYVVTRNEADFKALGVATRSW